MITANYQKIPITHQLQTYLATLHEGLRLYIQDYCEQLDIQEAFAQKIENGTRYMLFVKHGLTNARFYTVRLVVKHGIAKLEDVTEGKNLEWWPPSES